MHDSTMNYLQPTDEQLAQLNKIRGEYKALLAALMELPPGRYRSLAVTDLESSAMWANKGVTRHSDGAPRKDGDA